MVISSPKTGEDLTRRAIASRLSEAQEELSQVGLRSSKKQRVLRPILEARVASLQQELETFDSTGQASSESVAFAGRIAGRQAERAEEAQAGQKTGGDSRPPASSLSGRAAEASRERIKASREEAITAREKREEFATKKPGIRGAQTPEEARPSRFPQKGLTSDIAAGRATQTQPREERPSGLPEGITSLGDHTSDERFQVGMARQRAFEATAGLRPRDLPGAKPFDYPTAFGRVQQGLKATTTLAPEEEIVFEQKRQELEVYFKERQSAPAFVPAQFRQDAKLLSEQVIESQKAVFKRGQEREQAGIEARKKTENIFARAALSAKIAFGREEQVFALDPGREIAKLALTTAAFSFVPVARLALGTAKGVLPAVGKVALSTPGLVTIATAAGAVPRIISKKPEERVSDIVFEEATIPVTLAAIPTLGRAFGELRKLSPRYVPPEKVGKGIVELPESVSAQQLLLDRPKQFFQVTQKLPPGLYETGKFEVKPVRESVGAERRKFNELFFFVSPERPLMVFGRKPIPGSPKILEFGYEVPARFPSSLQEQALRSPFLGTQQRAQLRRKLGSAVRDQPGKLFPGVKTSSGLGQEREFVLAPGSQVFLKPSATQEFFRQSLIFRRGRRFTIDPATSERVEIFDTTLKKPKQTSKPPSIKNIGKEFAQNLRERLRARSPQEQTRLKLVEQTRRQAAQFRRQAPVVRGLPSIRGVSRALPRTPRAAIPSVREAPRTMPRESPIDLREGLPRTPDTGRPRTPRTPGRDLVDIPRQPRITTPSERLLLGGVPNRPRTPPPPIIPFPKITSKQQRDYPQIAFASRQYTPSLAGVAKGLRFVRIPKTKLTGLEIRPAISKTPIPRTEAGVLPSQFPKQRKRRRKK